MRMGGGVIHTRGGNKKHETKITQFVNGMCVHDGVRGACGAKHDGARVR